ncbi:hypothetical protein A0H76_2725 [Hepatospora eriocheir]|uniref:Uncharacterized protein n=1 Tax=Hepatospora eriocheir TaxID=1081669 RepID=A0A1X0QA80_9MICR|nr:hypothetical protein HERIO_1376 [Hepatospora eriocheir]ORD99904.1 hypothetical protein A0H76_2725 [Hepatospora eriocheir]
MFVISPNVMLDDETYTIIGELNEIDGDCLTLKVNNNLFKVKYKDLEEYKSKYVLVEGIYRGGVLNEELVYKLEDDFNFNNFLKLASLTEKQREIF